LVHLGGERGYRGEVRARNGYGGIDQDAVIRLQTSSVPPHSYQNI